MAWNAINRPNVNPAANPAFQENTTVTSKGASARRQFAWLERSKYWPELPQTEWRAQKVLGMGNYAIAGLFSYIGSDSTKPRQLVVKQSNTTVEAALRLESKILHLTTGTGTDHIVKLYKGCHRAGGTGTGENDPLPYYNGAYNENMEVARIYLEYASGGDGQALLDQISRTKNYVIPEEHLWRILDCLARACLVLEQGSEDTTFADPNWRPICHFDIKPENVLIGSLDQGQHQTIQAFKLADFGLSVFEASQADRQTDVWKNATQWRATAEWMSPEQYFGFTAGTPFRDISAMTNIWAIGAVIHRLITNSRLAIARSFMYQKAFVGSIRVTGDPNTILNDTIFPYSEDFVDTLCGCLAHDPAQRTKPAELIAHTTYILNFYNGQNTPFVPNALRVKNTANFNIPPTGHFMQNFPPSTRPRSISAPLGGQWPIIGLPVSPDSNQHPLLFTQARKATEMPKNQYPFTDLPATP